jgi:hypothetical protein
MTKGHPNVKVLKIRDILHYHLSKYINEGSAKKFPGHLPKGHSRYPDKWWQFVFRR